MLPSRNWHIENWQIIKTCHSPTTLSGLAFCLAQPIGWLLVIVYQAKREAAAEQRALQQAAQQKAIRQQLESKQNGAGDASRSVAFTLFFTNLVICFVAYSFSFQNSLWPMRLNIIIKLFKTTVLVFLFHRMQGKKTYFITAVLCHDSLQSGNPVSQLGTTSGQLGHTTFGVQCLLAPVNRRC